MLNTLIWFEGPPGKVRVELATEAAKSLALSFKDYLETGKPGGATTITEESWDAIMLDFGGVLAIMHGNIPEAYTYLVDIFDRYGERETLPVSLDFRKDYCSFLQTGESNVFFLILSNFTVVIDLSKVKIALLQKRA
jgi:hypothetical protein